MKALQIERHGAPSDVVKLADLPEPGRPKRDEVLVGIEYAPINMSEILRILGKYPLLPGTFPALVGNEGVGRVMAVGDRVRGLAEGDRVLVPPEYATWREQLLLPASGLFVLPAGADPQQLAMGSINPPTAALMLSEYVDLEPGDWVIQNAGNSGVGRSVIAVAKTRGLRTISVVRRKELVDEVRAAGTDVALLDGPDLAARAAEATKKARIKLALDGVAGESGTALAQTLTPGGTFVVYSFMSRQPVQLSGTDVVFRDVVVRGFWLYSPRFRDSPKIAEAMKLGARLVAEGKLKVPVAAAYPLTESAAALAHAAKGGKILFEVSPR